MLEAMNAPVRRARVQADHARGARCVIERVDLSDLVVDLVLLRPVHHPQAHRRGGLRGDDVRPELARKTAVPGIVLNRENRRRQCEPKWDRDQRDPGPARIAERSSQQHAVNDDHQQRPVAPRFDAVAEEKRFQLAQLVCVRCWKAFLT